VTTISDPGSRLRWAVTDGAVLTGRCLTHLRHQPAQLATAVGFPILLVLMFGYLLGGMMVVPGGVDAGSAGASPGDDYRQALLPGLFAMTMLFGSRPRCSPWSPTHSAASPTGFGRCRWRPRRCSPAAPWPTW